MKKLLVFILLVTLLISCATIPSDYETLKIEREQFKNQVKLSKEIINKLELENKLLQKELDVMRFGADRLSAEIEKAFKENKYELAKEKINLLYEKHPESPKNHEFKNLLNKIMKIEKEQEKIRLENLKNLGIWETRYFVDEFREPTKDAYITNSLYIRGSFSNTATQNSKLNVSFIISGENNISIKLYEYASTNPVKAYSYKNYNILLQDNDGNRFELKAVNRSDRLSFNNGYSIFIHRALLKGGTVKFKIIEEDNPTTNYLFVIENADWYENAYRDLTEKED